MQSLGVDAEWIPGEEPPRGACLMPTMPTRRDTTHATTCSQALRTILGSGPANPTRRPVRGSVVEEEREEDEEASSDEDEPAAAGVEDAGAPTPAKKGRGRPRKQADAAVGTTQPSRQPVLSAVRNSAATTRRPVRNSRRNSALGPGDAPPAAESIRRMAKDDKALDAKSAEELRSQVSLKKKLFVFVYTLNHVP